MAYFYYPPPGQYAHPGYGYPHQLPPPPPPPQPHMHPYYLAQAYPQPPAAAAHGYYYPPPAAAPGHRPPLPGAAAAAPHYRLAESIVGSSASAAAPVSLPAAVVSAAPAPVSLASAAAEAHPLATPASVSPGSPATPNVPVTPMADGTPETAAPEQPPAEPNAAALEDPKDAVAEFLKEQKQLERKQMVDRVLKSFRLDPLAVLSLPRNPAPARINKNYRLISLLIHPDKCDPSFREEAQEAFTALAQAKAMLADEAKMKDLDEFYEQSTQKVLRDKTKEWKKSIRAEMQRQLQTQGAPDKGVAMAAHAKIDLPVPDFAAEPSFDEAVREEVKQTMADREWQRRQVQKIQDREERQLAEAKAELKEIREQMAQDKQQWEETREKRVGSWRDFQKGKKKKRAMPLVRAEDADNTYIRRPVKKQK